MTINKNSSMRGGEGGGGGSLLHYFNGISRESLFPGLLLLLVLSQVTSGSIQWMTDSRSVFTGECIGWVDSESLDNASSLHRQAGTDHKS